MHIENWIKAEALSLGFPYTGITHLAPPPHLAEYRDWIAAGRHAGMAYLSAEGSVEKRADPRRVFPAAKSLISLAMPYAPAAVPSGEQEPLTGRVAAYAWNEDYHDVIPARLAELARRIASHLDCRVAQAAYTDTGPILERDLAQRAGLGWIGKNTCLILPHAGSFYFLAELFVDIALTPDAPYPEDRCGACRRCIEACPTGCIRPDRTLDAARCLSYLTIEHKGPIPVDLRPQLGKRVFGCDVCQQVCPWNRFAGNIPIDPAFQPRPGIPTPILPDEIRLDARAFNQKFRASPIRRAKRRGYLRNVCIALGNSGQPAALPGLSTLLFQEPDALIRGAAAWAMQRIAPRACRADLEKALSQETDPQVRQELTAALSAG